MPLGDVTIDSFRPHVGTRFRLDLGDGKQAELELLEVTALTENRGSRSSTRAHREPFSLVFRGPDGIHLAQQMVPLQHDSIETLSMFIVPIGRVEDHIEYEAIFT